MCTIGIIGTAGRRDDKERMSRTLYELMLGYAAETAENQGATTAISGGAAWADHVAVDLFKYGVVKNLKLILPAEFKNSRFVFPEGNYRHPGSVSTYYHRSMSAKLGINTLRELQLAIDNGAEVQVIPGFKARNTPVANLSEYLLAFTFGTHSGIYHASTPGWTSHSDAGLKDGGTADTWDKAQSKTKEHMSLWDLQNTM